MKYRIRNANFDRVIEGDTMEEIIEKLFKEDPDRAPQSFTWKKVED